MKVRFLTASSYWGGLEGHTVGLAQTLSARGHDVAVVELGREVFADRKTARDERTEVIHVPLPVRDGVTMPLPKVSCFTWWRILRGLRADVGVFAKGDFDGGSWRLDVAARLCFRRYVTIEHSATPMPPKTGARHFGGIRGFGFWWYRMLMNRRLRSPWPHAVVCVSDAVRRPLANEYLFARRKLATVHNGIDSSTFKRDPERRLAMRERWRVPADALVFGTVGRLTSRKGCELAIELFDEVSRQCAGPRDASGARRRRPVTRGSGEARSREGPERSCRPGRLHRTASGRLPGPGCLPPAKHDRRIAVGPAGGHGLPLLSDCDVGRRCAGDHRRFRPGMARAAWGSGEVSRCDASCGPNQSTLGCRRWELGRERT